MSDMNWAQAAEARRTSGSFGASLRAALRISSSQAKR